MTEQQTMPTNLTMDDAAIISSTMPKVLRAGDEWYQFLIINARPQLGREGSKIEGMLQINMSVQAMTTVDDPESTTNPTMYVNIPVPVPNPDIDGYVLPTWAPDICAGWMAALFPEEVQAPRFNAEEKVWTVNGEEIDRQEKDSYKLTAALAARDKAVEIFQALNAGENPLSDLAFYGKVVFKNDYRNINVAFAELPDDATLADPDNFFEEVEYEIQTPTKTKKKNGKSNGKKRK